MNDSPQQPPTARPDDGGTPTVSGTLVGLVAAAAIFNFLACPILRGLGSQPELLLFVWPAIIGILVGETGALALWLVWGSRPFLTRLAIHWGVAFSLLLSFLLGLAAANADLRTRTDIREMSRVIGVAICVLPIISLAVQAPHWPLRTHFGWRVELPRQGAQPARAPLSILDILAGTAVVAVTLGLVRAVSVRGGVSYVWAELVGMVVLPLAGSLLLGLPALLLLRTGEIGLALGIFAGYLFGGYVVVVLAGATVSQAAPPAEAFVVLLIGLFSLAATVAAPLLVMRASGYRLTWPRDRRYGNF